LRSTSGYYYTPECDSMSAGYLILPEINGEFEVRNSLQYLEKVASGNVHYGELPNLYHGFVRSNIIGELLRKGSLFMKAAPDIFSDINIAAININYGSLNYPLSLGVASPKSNGLNFAKNNNISKEYREMSLNELPHKYHIDNVNMHVVECLEFVLKKYDLNISIDKKKFYTDIIKYEKIKIIITIIDSLKMLSLKSTPLIILDMLLLLPCKIRNIPFDFNKRLKFFKNKLNINLSKRDAVFSYSGDLRKINISNPKGCIEFIEKNVILKI
jgi:hypothetical protein